MPKTKTKEVIINKTWIQSDMVCFAIGERSTRDAAEWLNEKIPADPKLKLRRSHSSVSNWVNGVYNMDLTFAQALTEFYPEDDERHVLGRKIKEMRADEIRKAHWVTPAPEKAVKS